MEDYLKTATILYVEDEDAVREGYMKPLKRYAKSLFIASDGEIGLELYKNNKIDIVVTDIKMPKMDGLTMIKEIKKINQDQIIIITSAHSDSKSFLEAISLQVDGYLLKPVDKNLLKEKINYFSKQIIYEKEMEKENILSVQKDKLASMGEMVTNIAHHWRQPLSVISTAATGLQLEKQMGILDDEKFEELTNVIVQNTEALSKTIEEFKSFIEFNDELLPFKIDKIINKVLIIIKQAMDNSKVKLVLDIDESLKINNYQTSLVQSLVAILNNSIEAFSLNSIKDRYIFISLQKVSQDIKLTIKDSAGGIEDSMLSRIFEAYSTTKHKYVGTGLGMYTTYSLIENKMKCNISVENETYIYENKEHRGAKFLIILRDYE